MDTPRGQRDDAAAAKQGGSNPIIRDLFKEDDYKIKTDLKSIMILLQILQLKMPRINSENEMITDFCKQVRALKKEVFFLKGDQSDCSSIPRLSIGRAN